MGKYSNSIERIKLIGMAGQSNMDGRGENADLESGYDSPITNAFIYQKTSFVSTDNGSWVTLEYNENNFWENTPSSPLEADVNNALHGSELYFAKDYVAATGNKLYLIKMGRGGTDVNGTTSATWQKDDAASLSVRYYDWLFQPAVQKLINSGKYIDFEGFIWFQGYSDCGTEAHANAYETNLLDVFNYLRGRFADFGWSTKTFYVNESPDWGAVSTRTQAWNDTLRAAQNSIGNSTNYSFFANTTYDGNFNADNIHVDSVGLRAIANLWLNEFT